MRRSIYRHFVRSVFLFSLIAILAACGGGEVARSTSTGGETTTTSPQVSSSSAPNVTSSTLAGTTTTTIPPIDVTVENGEVRGPERVQVERGQTVSVSVLSDEDGQVHVHGYDIFYAMPSGEVVEIEFQADIAGIFEVEVEETGLLLFEVEVAG